MHLMLTDILTCPRCGPEFGLILLADRMEGRRVLEGRLGCSNCRERYEVRGGFADLRVARVEPGEGDAGRPARGGRAEAFGLAALLGVAEGPGLLLVVGSGARLAPGVAAIVEGVEVMALDASLVEWEEEEGVSRLAGGERLPFRSESCRSVALTGDTGELLEEGARVLEPGGRLVVERPPAGLEERLGKVGMGVAGRPGGVVIAVRA